MTNGASVAGRQETDVRGNFDLFAKAFHLSLAPLHHRLSLPSRLHHWLRTPFIYFHFIFLYLCVF